MLDGMMRYWRVIWRTRHAARFAAAGARGIGYWDKSHRALMARLLS